MGSITPPQQAPLMAQPRIGSGTRESLIIPIRSLGIGYGSIPWATSNLARFTPFRVKRYQPVARLWVQTNTGANIDIGIYDEAGNLLVSSGSFAGAGDAYNVRDVTDISLAPGNYYFATACDNGAGQLGAYDLGTSASAALARAMGLKEMTSAFPLPSTATLGTPASGVVTTAGILGDTTS